MNGQVPTIQENRWSGALLAGALLLVAAAYAPALGGGFSMADHATIERAGELDPTLRVPAPAPVVQASYAIDEKLGRGGPAAFHATNLLLHLGCCALLFGLLRRIRASAISAALAVALFGAFPRLTDAVAWISGRSEVLAALGTLAALGVWGTSWPRRTIAGFALLAGLFSDPIALAGAVGLVARELLDGRRTKLGITPSLLRLAPVWVAVAAFLAVRAGDFEKPTLRMVSSFESIGRFALMTVDALRPRLLIGFTGEPSVPFAVAGGVLFVVLAFLFVRATRRGLDPVLGGLCATSLAALVGHALLPGGNVVAADRFLYVPLLAVSALAAIALDSGRFRTAARSVAGIALLLFLVATGLRANAWSNELKLWRGTLAEETRHPWRAEKGLADALAARGMYVDAVRRYQRAYDTLSRDMSKQGSEEIRVALLDLGEALQMVGQYENGLAAYDELLVLEPSSARARYGRALLELRRFKPDAAARELYLARDGADDALSRRLLALVQSTRKALAELPAEKDDEAPELTAKRAELFVELGAVFDAVRSWRKVLEANDAPEPLRRRAAAYIVERGSPKTARQAVEALSKRVAPDASIAALSARVSEREREVAEAK